MIGLLDHSLLALDIQRRMTAGKKHSGEEEEGTPDSQLLLWDRQNAFRPRVLFVENVPAETL